MSPFPLSMPPRRIDLYKVVPVGIEVIGDGTEIHRELCAVSRADLDAIEARVAVLTVALEAASPALMMRLNGVDVCREMVEAALADVGWGP